MRARFLAPILLVASVAPLSALFFACGSSDSASSGGTTRDAGTTGATGLGDDGGTSGGSVEVCNTYANQANSLAYFTDAAAGCSADSDCSVDFMGPTCVGSCGGAMVSAAGTPIFTSAVDQANSGPCATFTQDGCTVGAHSCPAEHGLLAPQCIAATCVPGYEAAWSSFTVQRQSSDTDVAIVGQCTYDCTEWTVTPDGQVAVTGSDGGASKVPLSAADFALIDGTLRDPSFRQSLLAGGRSPVGNALLPCAISDAGYPPSVLVLASIDRPVSQEQQGDVTGCTAGDNAFAPIWTALQTY